MNTKSIMIVGVGGQGTLLTSRIIGKTALNAGFDVKLSEVHGMAQRGGSPEAIADELDLWIKEDTEQLSAVIDEIIASNPKAAEQYRSGDQKVFGFFMGQANKALKGAASPKAIQEQLIAKLRR